MLTIDALEALPETEEVAEELDGLMPCWVTLTCWFSASIFTTTGY